MYEGLKNLEVTRRGPRSGRGSGPRRRHPRLRAGLIGLLVLALIVASFGGYTLYKVTKNIAKGKDPTLGEVAKAAPNGPLNILVVGSDSREFIDKREQRDSAEYRGPAGQRADSIILLHVSGGENKRAVLVHFPRDLRVDIPGHGTDKINAAYAFGENKKRGGGANLLMKTIKGFTGLEINHYVEVNFGSFRQIVDAVGGVKIYVNRRLDDKRSGLHIPKAGCYTMNGKTALAFVRARYIDPTADLGRIQRQQLFMRSLLRKVKSVGFLLDFGRLIKLSEAIGDGVRYDPNADVGLARSVSAKVAGFDQDRVDFRMVPSDPKYIGGISYVVARPNESKSFFAAIKADGKLPPYGKTAQSVPKKGDVTISVLNGTGKAGFAGTQGQRLRQKGFKVVEVGNANSKVARTVITFQAGADLKADLVAKYYKSAVKRIATGIQGPDVVVSLGSDLVVPSGSPTPSANAKASAEKLCV